jgi:ribosome-binding protein aMBF1 (putative translation factor)
VEATKLMLVRYLLLSNMGASETDLLRASIGTDHQRIAKLDRENEVAPPPKVAPSVGKAIQTARMEKEMAQKDLAQKVNEKPSVIQDYESGRAIPNPQILGKLERVLGVKLRGAYLTLITCESISLTEYHEQARTLERS